MKAKIIWLIAIVCFFLLLKGAKVAMDRATSGSNEVLERLVLKKWPVKNPGVKVFLGTVSEDNKPPVPGVESDSPLMKYLVLAEELAPDFSLARNRRLLQVLRKENNPDRVGIEYKLKRMGAREGYIALYQVGGKGLISIRCLRISSVEKLMEFIKGFFKETRDEYLAIYRTSDILIIISSHSRNNLLPVDREKVKDFLGKYKQKFDLDTVWYSPRFEVQRNGDEVLTPDLKGFLLKPAEVPLGFEPFFDFKFMRDYELMKNPGRIFDEKELAERGARMGYAGMYGKEGVKRFGLFIFDILPDQGIEELYKENFLHDEEEYLAIYRLFNIHVFIWGDFKKIFSPTEREELVSVLGKYQKRLGLEAVWKSPLLEYTGKFEPRIPVVKFKSTVLTPAGAFPGENLPVTIRDDEARFSDEKTTSVDFGPLITVDSFRVDDPTQITAYISIRKYIPHEVTHNVKVITAGQERSYFGFNIILPSDPIILSIEPGPGLPEEEVIIHGRNFCDGCGVCTSVFFGYINAAIRTVRSDEIVTVAPPGFREGVVTVISDYEVSNSVDYSVLPKKVMEKIRPIEFGQTVEGKVISRKSPDKHTFDAEEGTVVTITVRSTDNLPDGSGCLEPSISLRPQDGESIAFDSYDEDDPLPGEGRGAEIKDLVIPATGTYTIVVEGSMGVVDVSPDKSVKAKYLVWTRGRYRLTLTKE